MWNTNTKLTNSIPCQRKPHLTYQSNISTPCLDKFVFEYSTAEEITNHVLTGRQLNDVLQMMSAHGIGGFASFTKCYASYENDCHIQIVRYVGVGSVITLSNSSTVFGILCLYTVTRNSIWLKYFGACFFLPHTVPLLVCLSTQNNLLLCYYSTVCELSDMIIK